MQPLHSSAALLGLGTLTLLLGAARQSDRVRLRSNGLSPEQEEILGHMSLVDLPDGRGGTNRTLRISGLNVQIVNGLGATNGYPQNPNSVASSEIAVNGLGNLILGYDEAAQFTARKTGSHNLVVGPYDDYTSFGGIVAGRFNRLQAPVSVVLAGNSNYATGISSATVGGVGNGATGDLSLVAGGLSGEARTPQSTVMGGQFCIASGFNASALGGFRNEASGALATVTGGAFNAAGGGFSSVSGGRDRSAPGSDDWAAGSLLEDQ